MPDKFGAHVFFEPAAARARTVPFINVNSIAEQNSTTVYQNNGDISDDTTQTPDEIIKCMLLLERPLYEIYGFQVEFGSTPGMDESIDEDASLPSDPIQLNIKFELVLDTDPWDATTVNWDNGDSLTVRNAKTLTHTWVVTNGAFIATGGAADYRVTVSNSEMTIYWETPYKVSDNAADSAAGYRIQGVKVTIDGTGYNDPNGWDANAIVRANSGDTTYSFALI